MDRLATLMWECIPSDNIIFKGHSKLEEKNIEELPLDLLDELYISRDEHYDIKVLCARRINPFNARKSFPRKKNEDFVAGESVIPGELIVKPYGDTCSIVISPCYYKVSA